MSEEPTKPSLYLLRGGDDTAKIKGVLADFFGWIGGDESMGDLNCARLNGENLSFEALQADALTIPFWLTDV